MNEIGNGQLCLCFQRGCLLKCGRWQSLSRTDAAQLAQYVSNLPTQLPEEDESMKRFDLLVLQLQLAHLEAAPRFNSLGDTSTTGLVNGEDE